MNLLNKKKLKIGLLQYSINSKKIDENFDYIINQIKPKICDIVILPEMGITGFNFINLEKEVLKSNEYISLLREIASKNHLAICTTLPYRENKYIYNRLFFITKEKDIYWYDKHYLINWGGFQEKNYFIEGNSFMVIQFNSWLVGFAICYDLRFPELFYHMNYYSFQKYKDFLKLIVIPSQWPSRRIMHFQLLSRSRAVENLCYVAATNCIGKTKDLEFTGKSLVADPDGNLILELNNESGLYISEIDLDIVQKIQEERPIHKDRYKIY